MESHLGVALQADLTVDINAPRHFYNLIFDLTTVIMSYPLLEAVGL